MSNNRSNVGALVGGSVLIALGLLSLADQVFTGFDFWGIAWPFFVIGFGALFFLGMFFGGRTMAGLAIPGSIITAIGLMLFLQNLFDHWESWAYGWTVIVMAVGLGIWIMGWYTENPQQRQSGWGVIKVGAILFLIFGGFFEMIFNSFALSQFIFPIALIFLGAYLLISRSGLRIRRQDELPSVDGSIESKEG